MSKLTFRADDDLVERVERLEASKSEVMREALRAYLDGIEPPSRSRGSLDALVEERVDALVGERLGGGRDVNVNITVETPAQASVDAERRADREGERDGATRETMPRGSTDAPDRSGESTSCEQCGEPIGSDHVYCPNCGEKRSRRVFCECGDEIRTDWSFCPSCGRRTPAADVLDGS